MYTFQSKYIAVEGAIGAGKTSLVLQLSKKYDARAFLEVVEENPFLPRFYEDIKSYAFRTQIFFLLSRYDQQVKAAQQDLFKQLSFSDYMFAKDRIFAHLTLSGNELNMYEHLYQIMSRDIPAPDLIVYLKASTKLLMKRIVLRDRPFERKISIQYMEKLNNSYENYFSDQKNFTQTRLVTINADELDFVGNAHDLEFICEQIKQKDR
ncbi:MAG TPA: deoxynucleoside kinase [Atribacterota bacterium]|nr:deoxynucleoside kinase [Atribacterota bacterium]HOR41833.1 deoxynucleoside kinase [Atribacterota bacterium]